MVTKHHRALFHKATLYSIFAQRTSQLHRTFLIDAKLTKETQWKFLTLTIVALLFYVHGKHQRSCRDGQLT